MAQLALSDSYSGTVAPGEVVISASTATSPQRYSYRFRAEAGTNYRFLVAPLATSRPKA